MNLCFWKQTTSPRKTEQTLKALEAENNFIKERMVFLEKRIDEFGLRTAYLQIKLGQMKGKINKKKKKKAE